MKFPNPNIISCPDETTSSRTSFSYLWTENEKEKETENGKLELRSKGNQYAWKQLLILESQITVLCPFPLFPFDVCIL